MGWGVEESCGLRFEGLAKRLSLRHCKKHPEIRDAESRSFLFEDDEGRAIRQTCGRGRQGGTGAKLRRKLQANILLKNSLLYVFLSIFVIRKVAEWFKASD